MLASCCSSESAALHLAREEGEEHPVLNEFYVTPAPFGHLALALSILGD